MHTAQTGIYIYISKVSRCWIVGNECTSITPSFLPSFLPSSTSPKPSAPSNTPLHHICISPTYILHCPSPPPRPFNQSMAALGLVFSSLCKNPESQILTRWTVDTLRNVRAFFCTCYATPPEAKEKKQVFQFPPSIGLLSAQREGCSVGHSVNHMFTRCYIIRWRSGDHSAFRKLGQVGEGKCDVVNVNINTAFEIFERVEVLCLYKYINYCKFKMKI